MSRFAAFIAAAFILPLVCRAQYVSGKVFAAPEPRIIILETIQPRRPYIAVTNYTGGDATLGRHLGLLANKIGVYNYGDAPLELWEYIPPDRGAGRIYIQNAKNILARLEEQKSQIDSRISALQTIGAGANVAASNAVAALQSQQVALVLKIQSQKENITRLQTFYHLTEQP